MKGQVKKYEVDYSMAEACSSDMKIVVLTGKRIKPNEENCVHIHSFWELIFVRKGTVTVQIGERMVQVSQNEMFLIPPNVYHAVMIEQGTRQSSIHFSFERIKSKGTIKLFDEIYSTFPAKNLFRKKDPNVGCLLEKLLENQSTDRVGKDARIQVSIINLVFYLYDILKAEKFSGFDPLMAQSGYWGYRYAVETLLCRYFDMDISQEELCNALGISTPSLTRIFTAVYGKSFGELKLELKMRNAKRLIRETNLPIGEIGKKIGYTSARGFLIAFRRSENCTPSEYRQKLKG